MDGVTHTIGQRISLSLEQSFLQVFSLVGFLQSEKGRGFAVPPNSVPKPFTIPAHDFERCNLVLMPMLDFA